MAVATSSKIVTIGTLSTFKTRMDASVRSAIDASAGSIKDDVVSEIMDEEEFNQKIEAAVSNAGAITGADLATDEDIDALFDEPAAGGEGETGGEESEPETFAIGTDYSVTTDASNDNHVIVEVLAGGALASETALMIGYTKKSDSTAVAPTECTLTDGKFDLGSDVVVDSVTVAKVAAAGE